MTPDDALVKKRAALKEQIAQGQYRTLVDVLFDGIGTFLQKLTRRSKPVSIWVSGAGLALATWLISALLSLILGEWQDFLKLFMIAAWLEVLAVAGLIAVKKIIDAMLTTLDESILEAMTLETNLDDLQQWLASISNLKQHLMVTLVVGILFGGVCMPVYWSLVNSGSPAYAFTDPVYASLVGAVLIATQHAIILNYLVPIFGFPGRLSRYEYQLYAIDPASSEIIDRLADLFNNIIFISAVILLIFTAGLLPLMPGISANLVALALMWGLLLIMFLGGHASISKIIQGAKWKTLNDVQAKIETLQDQEEIPTKETLEHVNALMDYHDRIRTTRNSALDVRTGLSFLQSLLLPVIALLLANIRDVIALIPGFGE